MAPLLSLSAGAGVIAAAQPSATPLEVLLAQYRTWLVEERGLAASTVLRYENTARRFLQRAGHGRRSASTPAGLTGADVNVFLLRECARVSAGSAKGRVAELRVAAEIPLPAGRHAAAAGHGRPSGRRLAAGHAAAADDDAPPTSSCCWTAVTAARDVGVRDFAIMMLVARLGLRSIEVARLELGDVDWRAGELVVRGKARRQDRLPLPAEVGEALVAYLSGGRNPREPGTCS